MKEKELSKVERARKAINDFAKNIEHDGKILVFDTRNFVGDIMANFYNDNKISIGYCYNYEYLEVLGLSNEEYKELIVVENDFEYVKID